MTALGLRARFVIAGALLVATTAASSAWSAIAFRRVSRVVDATLRDSEQTTAATGTLAGALEREDDALLLTLTDEDRGRAQLAIDRASVASALARLDAVLVDPGERDVASAVRRDVDAYHAAGDALLARASDAGSRSRYHDAVNPLLRRAVGTTTRIQDDHLRNTQEVAAWARDQATRATQILALVFAAALVLSLLVAYHLARVVVAPIRALTTAVDALRRNELGRRVPVVRRDELGRLAEGFNRMADDLAEFRRANIGEVIRAKETLEATLAALPDAVLIIDAAGEVSSANPRASAVIASAHASAARDALDGLIKGGPGKTGVDLAKALAVTIDGESRKLLPRVVPIEGLPGGRGAVLVLSDVTDLVRLDEMRMDLVAVASHELRTPLTTLRMTLLMLQERAARFEAREREIVATALLGIEQLGATVSELLDLTRIEAGELRLAWDSVDVRALVAQAASSIEAPCKEAGILLHVDVDDAPEIVDGDTARLALVFSNILTNALKYTPAGGAIRVKASAEAGALRVAISDDGPGVPIEMRERVFEKFFRVEHYRAGGDQGVRGSGIGLYVAREVLAAHGGTIRCEEAEGGGARFVVKVPVRRDGARG